MKLPRRSKRGRHFILYFARCLNSKAADFEIIEDKRRHKAGKSLHMLLSVLPPPPLLPIFNLFELHGHSIPSLDIMLDVSTSYAEEVIETCFSECFWTFKTMSEERFPTKPEYLPFKEKLLWLCIKLVYLLPNETIEYYFRELIKLARSLLSSPDLFKASAGLVVTFLLIKRQPEPFEWSRESKSIIMQIFKLRALNTSCNIASSEQEKWLVQQANWLWTTFFKPHLDDYFKVNEVEVIEAVTTLIEHQSNEEQRTEAVRTLLHNLAFGELSAEQVSDLRVAEALLCYFQVSVYEAEEEGYEEEGGPEKQERMKRTMENFLEIIRNIAWVDEHLIRLERSNFERLVEIIIRAIESCFDNLLIKLHPECRPPKNESPYRMRNLDHFLSFCPLGLQKRRLQGSGRPEARSEVDDLSDQNEFPLWGSFYYFDDIMKSVQLISILHLVNKKASFLVEDHRAVAIDDGIFVCQGLLRRGRLQNRFVSQPSRYWWLTDVIKTCPFLVPFDQRRELLVFSGLGERKALQDMTVVVMNWKKMKVSRDSPLESLKSIDSSALEKDHFWEFQFEGELANGEGPTKEFYELFSKDVQRHDLNLWIGESFGAKGEPLYASAARGLYPSPVPGNAKPEDLSEIESNFFLIGKLMAKVIKDFKMLSIPLNTTFYKLILCWGSNRNLMGFEDFLDACPHLSVMARDLLGVLGEKRAIEENDTMTSEEKRRAIDSLTYDGCSFEDLCLDFTLPCHSDIEMVEGGRNVPLTPHNIEEYLHLLVEWYLRKGPELKLNAFKRGFESITSFDWFTMFYPQELDLLVNGESCQPWTLKDLSSSCNFDRGYSVESQPVQFLFEVLETFAAKEQTLFLQFVTSFSRLPPGGLVNLIPRLTICPLEADHPDEKLPTAATCFNVIHLPRYTCLEIAREKILFAITEGHNGFGFV